MHQLLALPVHESFFFFHISLLESEQCVLLLTLIVVGKIKLNITVRTIHKINIFVLYVCGMKGVGPVVTFQDMVMQASNGVLPQGGVNSSEIGNKVNVCGNDNSVDASSDQATPILNLEALVHQT